VFRCFRVAYTEGTEGVTCPVTFTHVVSSKDTVMHEESGKEFTFSLRFCLPNLRNWKMRDGS
jgi:hypothetical protein